VDSIFSLQLISLQESHHWMGTSCISICFSFGKTLTSIFCPPQMARYCYQFEIFYLAYLLDLKILLESQESTPVYHFIWKWNANLLDLLDRSIPAYICYLIVGEETSDQCWQLSISKCICTLSCTLGNKHPTNVDNAGLFNSLLLPVVHFEHLILPPFQNIRCFRFMKQMYLDMF
jgi:hypothetical protein